MEGSMANHNGYIVVIILNQQQKSKTKTDKLYQKLQEKTQCF
jgi:hypothetical protein